MKKEIRKDYTVAAVTKNDDGEIDDWQEFSSFSTLEHARISKQKAIGDGSSLAENEEFVIIKTVMTIVE